VPLDRWNFGAESEIDVRQTPKALRRLEKTVLLLPIKTLPSFWGLI
jgi:hypothetical protein